MYPRAKRFWSIVEGSEHEFGGGGEKCANNYLPAERKDKHDRCGQSQLGLESEASEGEASEEFSLSLQSKEREHE